MPQPQRANSSSSVRAQSSLHPSNIVTFSWTRPVQTQEIVLPPASPYIIYVIQFLRAAERNSSIQQADCSSHPQRKTSLQTHTGITPTEVTTGVCMANMHTYTYAKTFLPSPVSCQDFFKHTHRHRILHIASLLHPTPHPAQSSHPQGLCVRIWLWTPAAPHLQPSTLGSEGNEGFRSSL